MTDLSTQEGTAVRRWMKQPAVQEAATRTGDGGVLQFAGHLLDVLHERDEREALEGRDLQGITVSELLNLAGEVAWANHGGHETPRGLAPGSHRVVMRLRDLGMDAQSIADVLDVRVEQVEGHLAEHGGNSGRSYVRQVLELHTQGLTPGQIAAVPGMPSERRVRHALQEAGRTPNRVRRSPMPQHVRDGIVQGWESGEAAKDTIRRLGVKEHDYHNAVRAHKRKRGA